MQKPKLIYYNDARHYSFYRYDPPMSLHQLQQPVDEILGTEVDTLVYGLASGQTFLHGSQVGERWGEGIDAHNRGVMWWRAAQNLQEALALGLDPLAVVIDRAHAKGRRLLCSLRMNDPTTALDENSYMLSRLKRTDPDILIGEEDPDNPHAATCADFARPEVRQERLAIIEEVCGHYGADGLELDPYVRVFFKKSAVREHTPLLTEFVREVRALLDRIGQARGEHLWLSARVHPLESVNLNAGMDLRAWLGEGLIDFAVATPPSMLFDAEMPIGWLAGAARESGAGLYVQLGRAPYDDRYYHPTIEMYRAAAANYAAMGADGLYLSDLAWPPQAAEYQILREMADTDISAYKDKHYLPAPREPEIATGPRHLPVELTTGCPIEIPFMVGDRLQDAPLRGATLGLRIVQCCPEDRWHFSFNDTPLVANRYEHFYGGIVSYTAARGGLPQRIDTHYWFYFDIPPEILREGTNKVEVVLEQCFEPLVAERILHQVEVRINYTVPNQPSGGQL